MTIDELAEWYRNAPAPEMPMMLNAATKVNDYEFFVNSHFEGLRHYKGNIADCPLYWRLMEMKLLIEANL